MSTEIKLIRVDEIEPLIKRLVSEALEERQAAQPPAPAQDSPEYLSVKKASLRFDLPQDTIRNWMKAGKLTKYKIHSNVRVRVAEIESLLQKA
jgi:hypothetical protein